MTATKLILRACALPLLLGPAAGFAPTTGFNLPLPGESFASVPDVDGDSLRDLVVGAPGLNLVQMFSGRTGALLGTFPAAASAVEFGRSLAVLDDLDLDGHDEIAIGDPGVGDGLVRVFSGFPQGGTFALLRSFGPLAPLGSCGAPLRYGAALGAIGDLSGDGVRDLVVGAPNWAAPASGCLPQGRVEIVDVRALPVTLLAELSEPGFQLFGTSVTGLGDVDGDGLADLVVGAPDAMFNPVNAAAFAYSGANAVGGQPGPMARLTYPLTPNSFGWSIADVGDLDADGVHDLVVGAPNFNTSSGPSAFRVFSGTALGQAAGGGVTPLGTTAWSPPGKALGTSVAALGDVDHDGRRDFLVGAGGPFNTTAGAVYLVRGSNFSILQILSVPGNLRYGEFVGATLTRNGHAPGMFIADPSSGNVIVR